MLSVASNTRKFFRQTEGGAQSGGLSAAMHSGDADAGATFRLMTLDEYETKSGKRAAMGKKYFKYTLLEDIVQKAALPSGLDDAAIAKERADRASLLDFLRGLLRSNPFERWTPDQAIPHPFVTDAPFTAPFTPNPPEEISAAVEEKARQQGTIRARAAAKRGETGSDCGGGGGAKRRHRRPRHAGDGRGLGPRTRGIRRDGCRGGGWTRSRARRHLARRAARDAAAAAATGDGAAGDGDAAAAAVPQHPRVRIRFRCDGGGGGDVRRWNAGELRNPGKLTGRPGASAVCRSECRPTRSTARRFTRCTSDSRLRRNTSRRWGSRRGCSTPPPPPPPPPCNSRRSTRSLPVRPRGRD